MGYELHITRAQNWAENREDYISVEEWLSLVERDSELTLNPRNGPYFAMWSGPSEYEEPWFNWFEGNIDAKYPDKEMLGKMLQIADSLGARVQGDDGELYGSPSEHPGSSPTGKTSSTGDSRMLPYERREILWNAIAYGTVLILVVAAILLNLW